VKADLISPKVVARGAWRRLRTSTRVARWVFGTEAKRRILDDLWDTTSIVLRRAIRRYVHPGDRVLELGTGHVAVLSIYCAKRLGARVVALDVSAQFIENAIEVAQTSGASGIEFLRSNWFSNVGDRQFEVIFGNIPYIPSSVGEAVGATREYRQIWDGGDDGCDQLRIVLRETPGHLAPHGRLLIGVNTLYLPRGQVLSLIRAAPGLKPESIVRVPLLPSEVYVVTRELS
jgi:release factor glutamine methyltransferase